MRGRLALIALLAVAAMLAGCGGGGGSAELTLDERVVVSGFEADVATTVLDGSGYGQLLESTDAVIAIARADPDKRYPAEEGGEGGRTMRQILSDAASDLAPYQPDLAAELDRAVATLD